MSCSICLDSYDTPVATPCGHIFCLDCLISSSQTSTDATQAPCPTCRRQFSLVTPNPLFIPERYRQFIDSNIRRVYIDEQKTRRLQEQVTRLEARVQSLDKQKESLMKRCESSMQAIHGYATREREARLHCEELQKELVQTKRALSSQTTLINSQNQRSVASAKQAQLNSMDSLHDINKVIRRRSSIIGVDNRAVKANTSVKKNNNEDYGDAGSSLSLKRRRVTRSRHSVPIPSTK